MSGAANLVSERRDAFRRLLDAMLAGSASKELVESSRGLIDSAEPEDLVNLVDGAVEEGIDFSLLKPAVSKMINLLSVPLGRQRLRPARGERLFSSLMAENDELRALLESGKPLVRELNELGVGPAASRRVEPALRGLREFAHRLGAADIHYKKLENVLFPWFEARYGPYRCVRLLWAIHDDVRAALRELDSLFSGKAAGGRPGAPELSVGEALVSANRLLGRLYFDLNTGIFREECALFPVLSGTLSAADGEALFDETRDYDFAFAGDKLRDRYTDILANEAAARYLAQCAEPAQSGRAAPASASAQVPPAVAAFVGRTGSLSHDVLSALFAAVPVDMTFVDENDKVAWFTDSPHRIFARSPAIVGRDVRNCHPGASVGRVVAILESFKRGEKDSEAFWLEMGGKFIHIEYFALRAADGRYLGTLECSQDLTAKRALSGEKRL